MTQEELTQKVIELNAKKHIKIYKLKQLEFSNKVIANLLSTNSGHVYNVLKKYKENDSLVNIANGIS